MDEEIRLRGSAHLFDTQNPLTWTKNGFVDPETTSFGNNMSGGADNSVRNYPTLRYFGGGIDLTF